MSKFIRRFFAKEPEPEKVLQLIELSMADEAMRLEIERKKRKRVYEV